MDPVKKICDELKVSREEALYYLEGFNWELNPAMEACRSKTLPPIRAKSFDEAPPSTQPRVLNKSRRIQPGIQSPTYIPLEIDPITQITPAKQPSLSRDQLVAKFCEVTGMDREYAVAILGYCNWGINTAVDRFVDGFVPPSSNPKLSLNDLPPMTGLNSSELVDTKVDWSDLYKSVDSLTSSSSIDDGTIPSMASSQEETFSEQPSELINEQLIQSFLEVSGGVDRGKAITYLKICNWDRDQAICLAMNEDLSEEISAASNMSLGLPSKSQSQASPSSMDVYPTKTEKPFKEAGAKHIPVDIPQIASLQESTNPTNSREETLSEQSSQLNNEKLIRSFLEGGFGATREQAIACLEVCNWELNQAVGFYMDGGISEEISAASNMSLGLPLQSQSQASPSSMKIYPTETEKPLKEAGAEHISVDIPQNASLQESTNPANSKEETISFSQLKDEKLIRSFLEAGLGATREQAIACLEVCNWELDQAVGFYMDGGLSALNMSKGLPSQSELDSQYQGYSKKGETRNSTNLTETEASPEEADEEDVTVAIPGMSSSQDKAVEEDSSKINRPTTITLTIILADGGSGTTVDFPFRSNQTVRDIRDAIEERTSNKDKNYYLKSSTGEDYMDLNITVYRLHSVGSTTLFQVFHDT